MVEVVYTDEFKAWWDGLAAAEQESVFQVVEALETAGTQLKEPYSKRIETSAYNMRELRIQHKTRQIRVLYVFDPRRSAALLLGGDKTGNWATWYRVNVPKADAIYAQYLRELEQ